MIRGQPRIILFDLETMVILREALKVWPKLSAYPGLTLRASITSVICAGWKVLGDDTIRCINAWDYKERWDKSINDDFMVVKRLSDVLRTADAIVTHNGKRFDWKFLQTRLLYHGLPRLPDIPHIDTCQVSKQNFLIFDNRLNTIADFLVAGKKLENGGWELWVDVNDKKPEAMQLMEAYCKHDVQVTENVFKKLRAFVKNMPNFALDEVCSYCANCGSLNLMKNGTRLKSGTWRQRYQCKECGAPMLGETIEKFRSRIKYG